jgi:hypothetical protein
MLGPSANFPPKPTWTAADVPDQTGKTVIVTGGNGGIGKETARVRLHSPHRVISLMKSVVGAALKGRQGVYRHALRGEVTKGDRRAQERDRKGQYLLPQARPVRPCLRQGQPPKSISARRPSFIRSITTGKGPGHTLTCIIHL